MKIERVNENKIKVYIDDLEAREWNITAGKICKNTPEAQKMFWHAIQLAKESVDFSIDGAKLFVETIPSVESGIGMFITRVCSESDLEEAVNNCGYKGRLRRSELRPANEEAPKKKKYIYRFEDFDGVCAAAGELSERYFGASVLYKMDEEFYLYLVPEDPVSLCETEITMAEFAQRVPHGQYVHGRLSEYGTVMIPEGAINVLGKYFCEV